MTFRLERVRDLRERAEDAAREELARELRLRMRGEALLMRATLTVTDARGTGRGALGRFGASGADMPAARACASEITAAEYCAAGTTANTAVLSAYPSVHGIV